MKTRWAEHVERLSDGKFARNLAGVVKVRRHLGHGSVCGRTAFKRVLVKRMDWAGWGQRSLAGCRERCSSQWLPEYTGNLLTGWATIQLATCCLPDIMLPNCLCSCRACQIVGQSSTFDTAHLENRSSLHAAELRVWLIYLFISI